MKNHKFYIVTLCYNCEEYINDCLESIVTQQYDNYKVIIIDDASSDGTVKRIKDFLNKHNHFNDRFNLIENSERKGPLANHIQSLEVEEIKDNDIILHLDGDDLLTCSTSLSIINKNYANNPNHLISYGDYESATGKESICKPWQSNISVSEYIAPIGWIFSHIRTFKYMLWKYIDKKLSFYDEEGKIFTSAGDVAIMKPLLELAGRKRTMFFNKKMYYYRDNTSLNEHNDHLHDQVRCALQIASKPRYNLLND